MQRNKSSYSLCVPWLLKHQLCRLTRKSNFHTHFVCFAISQFSLYNSRFTLLHNRVALSNTNILLLPRSKILTTTYPTTPTTRTQHIPQPPSTALSLFKIGPCTNTVLALESIECETVLLSDTIWQHRFSLLRTSTTLRRRRNTAQVDLGKETFCLIRIPYTG